MVFIGYESLLSYWQWMRMVFDSILGSFMASRSIVINSFAVELAVPWIP
jgi:hypothetical protein